MQRSRPLERVLVTGGAGFIGSSVLRTLLARKTTQTLNFDALTYAGLPESVRELTGNSNYRFFEADLVDSDALRSAVLDFRPDTIVHLAAESHVDRSIAEPQQFVRTNVEGTASVLRVWRDYRDHLSPSEADQLLLVHTSTDEVYGPLADGMAALEGAPYAPSSPYSASKAAADHLVRAYWRTYGLASVIVCPTNNYGPRQFPEKLIPLATLKALRGQSIPLYGDGRQVRDWLHVSDCAAGIEAVAERGTPGETYHLGAASPAGTSEEWSNKRVVQAIAETVATDLERPAVLQDSIQHVEDRPGHDRRYALDSSKARSELGWAPQVELAQGLRETVRWYLENPDWVSAAERRA